MNTTKISRTLLAAVLTSGFTIAPLMAPLAQAAPPSHAPAYGRRAKDAKQGKKYDKRDQKRAAYDRNRYDNDRDYRDRYDRDARNNRNSATYSGTVTNVRSGNSFDLSANGRTYNVYTTSGIPRGLNQGDRVNVYGRPYGDNDIRNATVRVTQNSSNPDPSRDDANDGNRYQTFSGRVTSVRNSREFNVVIGSTTYNVYTNNEVRNLNNNDEVRIYGQRVGSNDIRNANATITRNR